MTERVHVEISDCFCFVCVTAGAYETHSGSTREREFT